METKQALATEGVISPQFLIGIYESLRELVAAQYERGHQLAVDYLTSEDEADRNEARARLEIAEELQKLISQITPVLNNLTTQDLPRS